MEPPACVQNAMMKQDKKPFTYTPGGIDLSEVRSPRMQRRIERNANLAGAGENPKPHPQAQHAGPLPPAALAAMRPQTQVQVFPQPPPPPSMKSIPPPPPPPICPLPTQKVTTSENQVLERPDMTKIIPENPMALLRKTGGPAPRPSMVDAVYQRPPSPPQKFQPPVVDQKVTASPPSYQTSPQRQPETQSPKWQPQQQSFSPVQQPQAKFQSPPPPQRDLGGQSPRWPQNPPAQQSPPVQQQQARPLSQSFESSNPSYQPPVIERQPTKVNSNVGSLYIPPINQNAQQNQRVVSPPTPPQREPQVQSPGTPTLREAPRPWQGKGGQQQELPPWARKEDNIELPSQITSQNATSQQRWQHQPSSNTQQQQQQQYSPRSPPVHQQPDQGQTGGFPIHIEIRAVPYPTQPQEPEDRKPNAVYVTQPLIIQHPGGPGSIKVVNPSTQPGQPRSPQPAQNQPRQNVYQQKEVKKSTTTTKQESSNTRIIPIQIEQTPPSTPNDRSLNRQLSWGQNPSQSNKFKVIQKITQTDEDVDDDTPITQHSARFTQEMPEQFKGVKISNGERFKQVPQQYQGNGSNNVLSSGQNHEGNGQPQKYVHPSEQTVPEPKKYMGGNIPSRSFKILQAMTAPDSCANVNNNEDLAYNHPSYSPYPYPPYYPPPYWQEYYGKFYPYEQSEPSKFEETETRGGQPNPLTTGKTTPLPIGRLTPQSGGRTTPALGGRVTPLSIPPPPVCPLPFWGYSPPNYQHSIPKTDSESEIKTSSSTDSVPQQNTYPPNYQMYYPPYFDPYYYYYYYYHGYPPIPSPYHFYPSASDSENIQSGCESSEELSSYSKKVLPKRRNSIDHNVQNIKQQFEVRCQSANSCIAVTTDNEDRPFLNNSSNILNTDALEEKGFESKSVQDLRRQFELKGQSAVPRASVRPCNSPVQKQPVFKHFVEKTDALQETHYEVALNDKDLKPHEHELCRLRSLKSVNDIRTYDSDNFSSESDSSDNEDSSEDETEEFRNPKIKENQEEEIIPHQLSVIFEESERADSRVLRPCSAMTDASTINENSDDDSLSHAFTTYHNVCNKLTQESSSSSHNKILKVGDNFVQAFEEQNESRSLLTLRSPSRDPDPLSPCILDDGFIETIEQNLKCVEENGKVLVNEQTYSQESYNINGEPEESSKSSVKIEEITENLHECIADNKDSNISGVVFRKQRGRQTVNSPKQNSDNDSDKDFWQILGRDKESPISSRTNSMYYGYDDSLKTTRTNSVIYQDSPTHTRTNSTIYDELKERKSPPPVSEIGRLMNVDNFVEKLEKLKRNSGLWDYDGIEFIKDPQRQIEQSFSDNCKKPEKNFSLWSESKSEYDSIVQKNLEEKARELESAEICHNYTNNTKEEILTENRGEELSDEIEKASENSDESVDFWSQIKNDEDDFQPKKKSFYVTQYESFETKPTLNLKPEIDEFENRSTKNSSSASSRHSSFSKRSISSTENFEEINQFTKKNQFHLRKQQDCQQEGEISNTSSWDEECVDETPKQNEPQINKDMCDSLGHQRIKERIEALKNSTMQKRHSQEITEDIQVSVKLKVAALETTNATNNTSKTTSTKSSIKSFEEYSDEEFDSGVNSDLSRHISDNEEFPELKKLTRYERAATHSRLFKLLQDECDEDEQESQNNEFKKEVIFDKFAKLSVRKQEENKIVLSRSKLNLALNKPDEKENTVQNPVNEKLADELVQSILKRRKGQIFRNIPKEKIYAAAIRILQEDAESMGTPSEDFSSLLSPLRGDTENSTPAQTPQEFYNEYKQYYDSWNTDDNCDLIPSKAFKLIQDHISASKLGTIEGLLAKCPRILSSKNVPKELTKLFEDNDCSSQTPFLDSQTTNEVTNTS